jgi:hypothetical protein
LARIAATVRSVRAVHAWAAFSGSVGVLIVLTGAAAHTNAILHLTC